MAPTADCACREIEMTLAEQLVVLEFAFKGMAATIQHGGSIPGPKTWDVVERFLMRIQHEAEVKDKEEGA